MSLLATAEGVFGESRLLTPVCLPEVYARALDKIRVRYEDFKDAGWTQLELTCCALKRYGHHGLALYLSLGQELGRVWTWCCEILCAPDGNGERGRLYYWRSAPECQLRATVGPHVVPAELAEERRTPQLSARAGSIA